MNTMIVACFLLIISCCNESNANSTYSVLFDSAVANENRALDPIDRALGNIDLRGYRFVFDKEGYYDEIIRVSFMEGRVPVSIEVGKDDDDNYDFILKYGVGNTLQIDGFPYRASEVVFVVKKKVKGESKKILQNAFKKIKTLSPTRSRAASCPFHIIEYRSDTEMLDYYSRQVLWCKINNASTLEIITTIYLVLKDACNNDGSNILFLAPWEDRIVKWNDGKIDRFIANPGEHNRDY